MIRTAFLAVLTFASFEVRSFAQAEDEAGLVERFQQYLLEEDYPEVFGDVRYRVGIEHLFTADIDGNGTIDLVSQTTPHFRQSATILIYTTDADGRISRVSEGLAPGPLVPVSGAHLDSHTLSEAADVTIGSGSDEDAESFFASAFDSFGGIVAYDGFLHVDNRVTETPYFIDMRHADLPDGDIDCEHFEFSAVDETAVGRVPGFSDHAVIVARVGTLLYLYRINAIGPAGRIDRTLRVITLPDRNWFLGTNGDQAIGVQSGSDPSIIRWISCEGAEGDCRLGPE